MMLPILVKGNIIIHVTKLLSPIDPIRPADVLPAGTSSTRAVVFGWYS